MFAVGEGIVGVICSETIFGDGAREAGGAVPCVGAVAAGRASAELPSEAGAASPEDSVPAPANGLLVRGAGTL